MLFKIVSGASAAFKKSASVANSNTSIDDFTSFEFNKALDPEIDKISVS